MEQWKRVSLPRGCKRKREASMPETEHEPAHLRLDGLPDLAVERIIQHLSASPTNANWRHFVSAETVHSLLKTSGSVARVARATFGTLDLSADFHAHCGVAVPGSTESSKHLALQLLSELGGVLRSLFIDRRGLPRWCAAAVAAQCRSLRELSITLGSYDRVQVWDMLQGVGKGLESLELDVSRLDAELIRAVAAHCRNARSLKLVAVSITASCKPMWAAIGDSLQEVSLSNGKLSLFMLKDLGRFCPNVTDLSFKFYENARENHRDVVGLCEVYANRLLSFSMPYYFGSREIMLRLAELCPNASVKVPLPWGTTTEAVRLIRSLGRGVSNVWVRDTVSVEGLANACPNLREVGLLTNLQNLGRLERTLRALLAQRNVQVLKIVGEGSRKQWSVEATKAILGIASKQGPLLETLAYTGALGDVDVWRRFIVASRSLKRIRVRDPRRLCCVADPSADPTDNNDLGAGFWAALVAFLCRSQSLTSIECSCDEPSGCRVESVANACLSARSRNISISVCGFRYL